MLLEKLWKDVQELKSEFETKKRYDRSLQNTHDMLKLFPIHPEHWRVKQFLIPEADYKELQGWVSKKWLHLEIPEAQPKSSLEIIFVSRRGTP